MPIPAPLSPSDHGSVATDARADALRESQLPTFGEVVDDIAPVIGVIVVGGPPVVYVLGPWLLLGLMLSAPFAVLVVFAAIAVVAVLLLAALAGIVATPYLVVRGLRRRHRASHPIAVAGAHVPRLDSRRVVA